MGSNLGWVLYPVLEKRNGGAQSPRGKQWFS